MLVISYPTNTSFFSLKSFSFSRILILILHDSLQSSSSSEDEILEMIRNSIMNNLQNNLLTNNILDLDPRDHASDVFILFGCITLIKS